MKAYKAYLFLAISFVFIFLPLISLAAVASTGAPCNPDVLPLYDGGKTIGDCPYLPENGSNLIHLKWDIQGNFKNPECQVNCLGGPVDNRTNCTGWPLAGRDSNNFISSTSTRKDLKPKDDVYVRRVVPGVSFYVSCQEKTTGTSNQVTAKGVKTAIKTSDVEIVAKRSIETFVSANEACEIPFDTIARRLEGNQVTTITEESFRGWAINQSSDHVGTAVSIGLGSGDKGDISSEMALAQCLRPNTRLEDIKNTEVASTIDNYTKNGNPIRVGLAWKEADGTLHSHAVIAYEVSTQKTSTTATTNTVYFLDPNGPILDRLDNCHSESISGETGTFSLLSCQNASYSKNTYPFVLESNTSFFNDLISKKVSRGTDTTADWLIKNYPYIPNFDSNNQGICYGWTDFVLRVAYLGDFAGYDYHPGDGKTVNKDCDINHYPLSAKKAGATNGGGNWLANVWSVWQGLFK